MPVLTGAMNNIPDSFATLNQRQENAALLRKAGVKVALVGNGDGDESTADNAELIAEFGHRPLVLRVPRLDDPATAEEHLADLVALA